MFIVNYIIFLTVMFIRLIFKSILSKIQKSIIKILLTTIYINLFDYKINAQLKNIYFIFNNIVICR